MISQNEEYIGAILFSQIGRSISLTHQLAMPCQANKNRNTDAMCGSIAKYVIFPELALCCKTHVHVHYNKLKGTHVKKTDIGTLSDIKEYTKEPNLEEARKWMEEETARRAANPVPDVPEPPSNPTDAIDLDIPEIPQLGKEAIVISNEVHQLIIDHVKKQFKINMKIGKKIASSDKIGGCQLFKCSIDGKDEYVIKMATDDDDIDHVYWEFCMYRCFETQDDLLELHHHNGKPVYYRMYKKLAFLVYKKHGVPLVKYLEKNPFTSEIVLSMFDIIRRCHESGIVCYGMTTKSWVVSPKGKVRYYGLHKAMKWVDNYIDAIPQTALEAAPISENKHSTVCPANANAKLTTSRIDDIESLMYIVLTVIGSKLPWEGSKCRSEGLAKLKLNALEQLMFQSSAANQIAEIITKTGFQADPDYDMLRSKFEALV